MRILLVPCAGDISNTMGHARPSCSRCQALRTNCVYEAQEGESRWSALRRRKRDVESDRDDMRELLSFLQTGPEAEALDIFHRIRANGFQDLLRLIQHARADGQTISSQHLPASPGPSDSQRLPSIRSMLSNPMDTDTQPPQSADLPGTRQQRLPSLSSDGSGESYQSSALSGPTRKMSDA